jgi:hypothetical protein
MIRNSLYRNHRATCYGISRFKNGSRGHPVFDFLRISERVPLLARLPTLFCVLKWGRIPLDL